MDTNTSKLMLKIDPLAIVIRVELQSIVRSIITFTVSFIQFDAYHVNY